MIRFGGLGVRVALALLLAPALAACAAHAPPAAKTPPAAPASHASRAPAPAPTTPTPTPTPTPKLTDAATLDGPRTEAPPTRTQDKPLPRPRAPQPPPAPTVPDYRVVTVERPGSLGGTVHWAGAAAVAKVRLPATPGATTTTRVGAEPAACAPLPDNPTLRLVEPGHALPGAVVTLEDLRAGHSPRAVGGLVEVRDCILSPHVQVLAPIGQPLVLANDDARPRDCTITDFTRLTGPDGDAASATVPIHLAAFDTVDLWPDRPGVFEVTCAGLPTGVSAWVHVASHPYTTVTDAAGRYRLTDVPPGNYLLSVWHPPVAIGAAPDALLRGAPVVTRVKVRIAPGRPTTRDVDLVPGVLRIEPAP